MWSMTLLATLHWLIACFTTVIVIIDLLLGNFHLF